MEMGIQVFNNKPPVPRRGNLGLIIIKLLVALYKIVVISLEI